MVYPSVFHIHSLSETATIPRFDAWDAPQAALRADQSPPYLPPGIGGSPPGEKS